MAWVVDTSVLLDIHLADPAHCQLSAACLKQHLKYGLVICPVTYVELAPAFAGSSQLQDEFLQEAGLQWPVQWTVADTQAGHRLWADHVSRKRAGKVAKRPIADVLIEAFAQRFQGLITRNPKHFTTIEVVSP